MASSDFNNPLRKFKLVFLGEQSGTYQHLFHGIQHFHQAQLPAPFCGKRVRDLDSGVFEPQFTRLAIIAVVPHTSNAKTCKPFGRLLRVAGQDCRLQPMDMRIFNGNQFTEFLRVATNF